MKKTGGFFVIGHNFLKWRTPSLEIEHNLTLSDHRCKKLLSHEIIIPLLVFLQENVNIEHNGKWGKK